MRTSISLPPVCYSHPLVHPHRYRTKHLPEQRKNPNNMSAIGGAAGREGLRRGVRRDPELYVLFGVMIGAFSLVGFYFGRKLTTASSEETRINIAKNSAPWNEDNPQNVDELNYKYKYYPNTDYRRPPKRAPSALHSVIVPNVTLPRHLHEKFNKYGRDNY